MERDGFGDVRARVAELAGKMLDSSLSASEQAELLRAIEQDAAACDHFVDQVALHAMLRDEAGPVASAGVSNADQAGGLLGVVRDDLPELSAGMGYVPQGDLPACGLGGSLGIDQSDSLDFPAAADAASSPGLFGFVSPLLGWRAIAGLVCVTIAFLVGVIYWQAEQIKSMQGRGDSQLAGAALGGERDRLASALYVATLSDITSCRWDPIRSTANFQRGEVEPGQSLSLLEGVSEVNTSLPHGGQAKVQLEGPLSMMLSSHGMPNIQYGKIAAHVVCGIDRFAIDTPLGRAIVAREASIGLSVAANEVELHVFAGEAIYEPLWPTGVGGFGSGVSVGAQQSLRASTAADGSVAITRSAADESQFVTYLSMAASRLEISAEYVEAIRQAGPLAYWRFEHHDDGIVRNEMADRLHCRIDGEGLRWRSYGNNRTAEFGGKFDLGAFGALMSDDHLGDEIRSSYSLEAWVKPGHFHHGAFFSLIEEPRPFPAHASPGMSLELWGPVAYQNAEARNSGRLRFMHRNPPGTIGGTSVYSQGQYAPRKWQHVVGVKDGRQLRLYINGHVVGEGEDDTAMASDLRVLIGQLYPPDPARPFTIRPFIGELDEVALYDRVLTAREIIEHCQLATSADEPLSLPKRPARSKRKSVPPADEA